MGFTAESRERLRPVLPLAGMVDVLFLLLIFVMSTYSMREQELQIDIGLPAAETGQPGSTQALQVILSFDAQGRVFLGEREVAIEQLQGELEKLASFAPDQPVIVRGDVEARFGMFTAICDTARAAGLTDISIATVEEK